MTVCPTQRDHDMEGDVTYIFDHNTKADVRIRIYANWRTGPVKNASEFSPARTLGRQDFFPDIHTLSNRIFMQL